MALSYRVSNGSVSKTCSASEMLATSEELVAGGALTIIQVNEDGSEKVILLDGISPGSSSPKKVEVILPPPPVAEVPSVDAPKAPAPLYSEFGAGGQIIDEEAKKRIEATHAVLASHGVNIDTKQQLFATGTRLAKIGYDTQEERKKAFESKRSVIEVAEELRSTVLAEGREDQDLDAKDIADGITLTDGKLRLYNMRLQEQALRGLFTRLDPSVSAMSYVLGLRKRIAAEIARGSGADKASILSDKGKIAEVIKHECLRHPDVLIRMRTRAALGDIFSIVSQDYAQADAPMVVAEILKKLPHDAKGMADYDPETTAWNLQAFIYTPTPANLHAVGEPIEGFVSIRSEDAGGSSLFGSGGVICVRCLNASQFTTTSGEGKAVHRGRVMINAVKIIGSAKKSIEALIDAWGTNRTEEVEAPPVPLSVAIPGFWSYLLRDKRSELSGVLRGRSDDNIKALTQTFFDERRDTTKLVRSDFAQAFTRLIQESDRDIQQAGEVAAGNFLVRQGKIRCDLEE